MPKLSVITIDFNNLAGLQKTMESVFEQTFEEFEYIIIDGGSADGSKEYIEQHSGKLSHWVAEKDSGIYNAMNKGIARAQGEYVFFLNSGDYFKDKMILENLMNFASGEEIIYGNIEIKKNENSYIKNYPQQLSFKHFLHDSLPHCASLIKKELFNKIGLFNEENKIVSDWEFFMKAICLYSATYKHIEKIITVFNEEGISSVTANAKLIAEEKQKVFKEWYGAFMFDYEMMDNNQSSLNAFKNSRAHQFADKILRSQLYRIIKKTIKF